MSAPLSLEWVCQQLRIDAGEDDALLFGLITAATRAVEVDTGRTFTDGANAFSEEDEPVAVQAALMLISLWYDNRDGTANGVTMTSLPLPITWLLWPLKRLTA